MSNKLNNNEVLVNEENLSAKSHTSIQSKASFKSDKSSSIKSFSSLNSKVSLKSSDTARNSRISSILPINLTLFSRLLTGAKETIKVRVSCILSKLPYFCDYHFYIVIQEEDEEEQNNNEQEEYDLILPNGIETLNIKAKHKALEVINVQLHRQCLFF